MTTGPLRAAGEQSPALVGGKARRLGELLAWGLPVPDGVVVPTPVYAEHAARSGLMARIAPLLARRDHRGAALLAGELIAQTPLAPALITELETAWRQLGAAPVAVRSSATAEDLDAASFAGQHDSFLNVATFAGLTTAIARCWASLWSERASRYRAERSIAPESVAMAVVVQRMVPATAAGVLFTVDPLTQDRARMLVEVVPGLGESLVAGEVRGESAAIDRATAEPCSGSASSRLLPAAQREELVRLGLQIEARAGSPQDIEFALSGGRVAILQARRITTLAEPIPEPAPLTFMDRRMQPLTLERYAIAPRPLDNLVFVRMVGAACYTAEQFGLVIDEADRAAFRQTLWHQQYRFPRSRLTGRLLLHPLRSFQMLRRDWLSWWMADARPKLAAISAPVDLAALTDAQLLARTDAILPVWEDLTNRRFHAVSSVDAERYLEWVVALAVGRKAAPRTTAALLSGIPSPTNEANDGLWHLSRVARQDPATLRAIREDAWDTLPEGGAFSSAWDAFMAQFGHRESGGFYLSLPTWRQSPDTVRRLLRSLVEVDRRPAPGSAAHVEARRTVEHRLRWFPWLRRRFGTLLDDVRALHRMREESHHDLTRPLDALQAIAGEAGRRLQARGLTRSDDDVFYLSHEELRRWLLSGPAPSVNPRELIAQRRITYQFVNARWQRNRPPPKGSGTVLRGVCGSAGRARGVARVVMNESQFDRLRPGEVLVCPHSNPSWTPLFLSASAVVSETGGAASHAAIVAREYGRPALLAVTGATRLIRDGDVLDVDGDSGRVTLVSAA